MGARLIDSLVTTEALSEAFSDAAVLRAMLDFEVRLAAAQAQLGLIPPHASAAIARAAVVDTFDVESIAHAARASATPAIAFVQALTARVRTTDADAAQFVHWGATSQDVVDTAIALCLARARTLLADDHAHLVRALITLSETHASTVMLGRTLLQPATPVTFGLKVAGWAAALVRAWSDVAAAFEETLVLQFGGAAGTLAALGTAGPDVQVALAASLQLACPDAPSHTQRDRMARLVCSFAVYAGALSKLATDIALLMQGEVGEVSERGGRSSTMPHKLNPSGCAVVLASASRLPGLASSCLASMAQAHERAVGGWQGEASIVRDAAQACGSALSAAAEVIDGLTVSPARMRANIEATGGVMFAERATFLLARTIGRDAASRLVTDAVSTTRASGTTFRDVLASMPEVTRALTADELASIDAPESYLGAAEIFRQRLIAGATSSLAP
jgi:3-carboxy-cis,cis-muconate cycloisomerase